MDSEKVEPDFLTMLLALMALGAATNVYIVGLLPEILVDNIFRNPPPEASPVWTLGNVTLVFLFHGSWVFTGAIGYIFIKLLDKYASQKEDWEYDNAAFYVRLFFTFLGIAALIFIISGTFNMLEIFVLR